MAFSPPGGLPHRTWPPRGPRPSLSSCGGHESGAARRRLKRTREQMSQLPRTIGNVENPSNFSIKHSGWSAYIPFEIIPSSHWFHCSFVTFKGVCSGEFGHYETVSVRRLERGCEATKSGIGV